MTLKQFVQNLVLTVTFFGLMFLGIMLCITTPELIDIVIAAMVLVVIVCTFSYDIINHSENKTKQSYFTLIVQWIEQFSSKESI